MRRKRWRSRSPKSSRKKIFFLVLLVFTILSVQSFVFIEKNLRPPLMNVAKIRIKQIATDAINTAITEQIAEEANIERLVEWKTDRNGNVTGFMLNYAEHIKITADTVKVVQKTLDQLQKMPEHIPLGQALDSAIIASFGPDIPIRFVPMGAVKVDLNTRQQNAGINMLLVEVFIRITVEVTIIIPFDTDSEIVTTEVPISYLLVVGDVPMYYFDYKGNPTPIEDPPVVPPTLTLPNLQREQSGEEDNDKQDVPSVSEVPEEAAEE